MRWQSILNQFNCDKYLLKTGNKDCNRDIRFGIQIGHLFLINGIWTSKTFQNQTRDNGTKSLFLENRQEAIFRNTFKHSNNYWLTQENNFEINVKFSISICVCLFSARSVSHKYFNTGWSDAISKLKTRDLEDVIPTATQNIYLKMIALAFMLEN